MASAVRSLARFACAAEAPEVRIDRLRRMLSAAETALVGEGLVGEGLVGEGLAGEGGRSLALGLPLIDATLGGGLGWGALHEIAAARETELVTATGFALALTARAALASEASAQRGNFRGARAITRRKTRVNALVHSPEVGSSARTHAREAVWIAEDLSLAENGAAYGPGLPELGLAPERLLTVTAARSRDVLWAMEEALRCRAVGVVIGELRSRDIDTVATRRLSLAAAAGNTLGLLLRTAPDDTPSAAATRWIIGTAPPPRGGPQVIAPRMAAHLVRNRRGPLGAWIVEWNSVEQRFELATHSEPVAGVPVDRPLRWRAKRAAVA
jgi:protein ImuA